MPNTFTAQGTDANGTGTPAALNRLVADTICGIAHLSKELYDAIEEHRKKPKHVLPTGYLNSYGQDIQLIFDALCARQYEYSTIELYTHINGEFIKWLDAREEETRITDRELYRFADDYVKNSRESAYDRLGEYADPEGRTLRYIIFYAVRAVFDICFNMNITGSMARPTRPKPQPPAPHHVTEELYRDVQTDRERLLLVLVNGLGLMPKDAAALRWDDFDESLERLEFTVVKSGKKRLIVKYVVTGYQHALRGCLERAGGNRDAYIFPSTSSRGGEHLCVRTLQYTLGRMLMRSIISQRVTLTTLRLGGSYMPMNWRPLSPGMFVNDPSLELNGLDVPDESSPYVPATPTACPDDDAIPEPVSAAVPNGEGALTSPLPTTEAAISSPIPPPTSPASQGPKHAAAAGSEERGSRKTPPPG